MRTRPITSRRRALIGAGALGLAGLGTVVRAASVGQRGHGNGNGKAKGDEDIGPGEDLMREHGVLRRVLLVYGEICRRLGDAGAGAADVDPGPIQKSALLIRRFIEGYHERQEEEVLFPRFERANRLVGLVRVLRGQHQAGRKVTERIQGFATAAGLKGRAGRVLLRDELLAFVRMYEPHAAREDTVLFPALHEIVSRSEYDAMGEEFERREHRTFGADGFEHAVAEIDAIEKTIGIEDLAQFTPRG